MDTILLTILIILSVATLGFVYINVRSKSKDEKENKEDQTISERKERVLQSVVMRRALMQTDWLQVPSNKDWIISCLHNDPEMDSAVRSTNLKAISKLFRQ